MALPITWNNGTRSVLDNSLCRIWWHHDKGGCANRWDLCVDRSVEYIANHVAFDRREEGTVTTRFRLLQKYLRVHPKDVCVVSTGLHDQAEVNNVAKYPYAQKVIAMLSYIRTGCKKVIWLSISAVKGDGKFKQNNTISKEWNNRVRQRLNLVLPDVAYIDLFPMSSVPEMHVDNVHLNNVYSLAVARFFM